MNFQVPDPFVRFLEVKQDDKDGEKRIETSISEHHINSKMMIHLPNKLLPPPIISDLTDNVSFYLIKKLAVHELCDFIFLDNFVSCGTVCAYSINTRLDVENCAAFTPTGNLFLLLDKFTYYELGISGKLSSHILRNPKNNFFVEIDTKAQGFTPTKNLYKRVHHALKNCQLKFDFHISWEPKGSDVCPSSLAKYFADLDYEVEEVESLALQSHHKNVTPPQVFQGGENSEEYEYVLEWLGALAMDIDTNILEISNLHPSSLIPLVTIAQFYSLYTPAAVKKTITKLREWLAEQDPIVVPWICITVFGPPDCLISWGKSENSYKTNGENFYTLIVFRNRLLFYVVEESKKPQRMIVKSNK